MKTPLLTLLFSLFTLSLFAQLSGWDINIARRNQANTANEAALFPYQPSPYVLTVQGGATGAPPGTLSFFSEFGLANTSMVTGRPNTWQLYIQSLDATKITGFDAKAISAIGTGTSSDFINGTGAPQNLDSAVNAWATSRGMATFDGSYSSLTGLPSVVLTSGSYSNPSWLTGLAWSKISSTPVTLSGYGITDAYPLSGNPSNFLTSITSSQITTALGFTPYNATNPSSYITQAGARGAISLTTTGTSGAATYNSTTGVLNVPQYAAQARSFATPSRTLVSATNQTGFQVSATRDAQVSYEGVFQTTSTIGGPSSITVFLETADTNSTTPGDWTIIATQVNSSTITLAVALQAVDVEPWGLSRVIPAGKYVRIRYGSVTGTASATINAQQQEVLLP